MTSSRLEGVELNIKSTTNLEKSWNGMSNHLESFPNITYLPIYVLSRAWPLTEHHRLFHSDKVGHIIEDSIDKKIKMNN